MDSGRTPWGAGGGRRVDPGGYASWVAWIEAFRRGDDGGLDALPVIDGRMGTYVEARLLERLSLAFSERVRGWQTALGARIVAAPPVDEGAVVALLRDVAPGLESLARVAASPRLPRALGDAMHDLLAQTRAGARDAVRESSRRLREPELQPRVVRRPRRAVPGPPGPAAVPVAVTTSERPPGRVADPGRQDRGGYAPSGPAVPAPRSAGVLGAPRPAAVAPQRVS